MGQAGKHGEKNADPYALIRMVEDMATFQLAGSVPAVPKYRVIITVVLAKAKTVLPTSWDDFDLQLGGMKPNAGVPKVVGFNDHMLDDNNKVIRDSLITWIAYIENAVAEGNIDFELKVIEADDTINCDFR